MPILLQRVLISSKNINIPTLNYATFHMYPDQWGYDYSWGSQWIEQHSATGRSAGNPLVLEEYGSKINHTEFEIPWQTTLLQNSSVAYDSFWQFGTQLSGGKTPEDPYSIEYGTEEYKTLAEKHAAAMLSTRPIANHN